MKTGHSKYKMKNGNVIIIINVPVEASLHMYKCLGKYVYAVYETSQNKTNIYWQYINSLGKPKRHVDLDNDMFYNFYKDLNAHVNDDETEPYVSFPDVNLQHNLDVDITADEITKCIENLNRGKASGPDSVLNEYIKHSSSLCMPVYVKLRLCRS